MTYRDLGTLAATQRRFAP